VNDKLNELFSWNKDEAELLKQAKKLTPNHRKNRKKNKATRVARKRNR